MAKQLTPAGRAMLISLRDTGDPYRHIHGRSVHGGAGATLTALVKRGYATGYPNMVQITEAGRAALKLSGTPNE